jgi:hypothetical protein
MNKEIIIGKKPSSLESGYFYAPYIPITKTKTQVIVDYSSSKKVSRKIKINKIFDLGLDIKDHDVFSPRKSLMSRYSKKIINNNYGTIEIKKPT